MKNNLLLSLIIITLLLSACGGKAELPSPEPAMEVNEVTESEPADNKIDESKVVMSDEGETSEDISESEHVEEASTDNSDQEEEPDEPDEAEPEPSTKSDSSADYDIYIEDDGTGEIYSDETMKKNPLLTDRDLDYHAESGVIKYTVNSIQLAHLEIYNQEMADFIEVESNTDVALISIDITAENTSDDDVMFYPQVAKLVTDTKKQVRCITALSDSYDVFYGNVEQNGQIIFIIPDDIDNIHAFTLRIDAPRKHDTGETVGDDIKIVFSR